MLVEVVKVYGIELLVNEPATVILNAEDEVQGGHEDNMLSRISHTAMIGS
jgi:hypothetical protein